MTLPLAQLAIMVEQPQPLLVLHNRVVRRPPHHRLQQPPPVREGPVRRVSGRISDIVGVAGRVGKVVDAILLVEPRRLKEAAVVVVREDRFARFRREDLEFPDRLGEGGVVVGEPSDAGAEGGDARAGGLVLMAINSWYCRNQARVAVLIAHNP